MLARLAAIPNLQCFDNVPLSRYTRFAIGGSARVLADASTEAALLAALAELSGTGVPHALIGGGSNLIADDAGFSGVVLRYTESTLELDPPLMRVRAGAVLQCLVDSTVGAGLRGLETMTGIPGWVGGAIYGNAGAYGHSIHEFVESVRFFDGAQIREIGCEDCEFRYRESVFKRHKEWIVLGCTLRLALGNPDDLRTAAEAILRIRNEKYPPTMRCAGSIFKNLILAELPESVRQQVPERVIREGKVPSAYFLEQTGAKGMVNGGIHVADYHANLIYNAGGGTAREVREVIELLKRQVEDRFGLRLEEEVQYLAG